MKFLNHFTSNREDFHILAMSLFIFLALTLKPEKATEQIPKVSPDTYKAVSTNYHPSPIPMNYTRQYTPVAVAEMNRTGVPASIKLAQAMLESGNGKSRYAKERLNHFGIRNKNGIYKTYKTVLDSWRDHSELLKRKYYIPSNDYREWILSLMEGGYAVDPEYGAKLERIIKKERLFLLDRGDMARELQYDEYEL